MRSGRDWQRGPDGLKKKEPWRALGVDARALDSARGHLCRCAAELRKGFAASGNDRPVRRCWGPFGRGGRACSYLYRRRAPYFGTILGDPLPRGTGSGGMVVYATRHRPRERPSEDQRKFLELLRDLGPRDNAQTAAVRRGTKRACQPARGSSCSRAAVGRKSANIHASLGVIEGIPVECGRV